MPPPTRTPPGRWIEAGLHALAVGGPDAVRIEPLAEELGITKGSFYRHFDDRNALLEGMLDAWERITVDQVIERVERAGGDARAKLSRLCGLPAVQGRQLLKVELAIRDWARRDPVHKLRKIAGPAWRRQRPYVLQLEVRGELVDPPGPRGMRGVREPHLPPSADACIWTSGVRPMVSFRHRHRHLVLCPIRHRI